MKNNTNGGRNSVVERPLVLGALLTIALIGVLLIASLSRTVNTHSFTSKYINIGCSNSIANSQTQFLAIMHYATSRDVPELTMREIRTVYEVLINLAPCNFLVFGLGHDSLMWAALNPRGTTLFLEEDSKLVHQILARAPALRIHTVSYKTQLYEAEHLVTSYKTEKMCVPPFVHLKGNSKCKLALSDMADDVYAREWDVILIDGPRGYFAEAPGRMGAIFSAAVMARARKSGGVTHVFLHDANRKVEKMYGEEFLCKRYLKKAVGRFWYFAIPPSANVTLPLPRRKVRGSQYCI